MFLALSLFSTGLNVILGVYHWDIQDKKNTWRNFFGAMLSLVLVFINF